MRHAAWLALLSMLLIFVGPLYSNGQALLEAQTASKSLPGFNHHAPAMLHGEESSTAPDAAHQHAGDIPAHHAECGYCVLLTHASALEPAAPQLIEPPFWSPQRPLALQQASYTFRPYSIAQVRAPPSTTV
ncbi:DUF2946 domain-containing protein [Marinobacter nanhaiticus D15-8W]|uniref:DUF2946 domain-containing protein n=1 Tax=Marinobacter nanhaiticus D15-8W TaxID=626887 RepID=N6W192_9GAMM|nr:DUF2946 domain-containing protein [Marinobacter nanhaiticus]ENO16275.1 DUF2946 domain-containing protein [Marinobacter nanhaiticus D15-8W]